MMKTKEQQKAMLLDAFVEECRLLLDCDNDVKMVDIRIMIDKYDAITAKKQLTADPYADEIFSGRILSILKRPIFGNVENKRLSDCPNVKFLQYRHGFGRKSREEYIEVMRKYNFLDKI